MADDIIGNRYRILREVGAGGMAKVYLAEDMNEGQVVAVKILYPHLGEDPSYIQRFSREAKLAGSLNDPHIVKVLDYGSSRDTHYLVMEYVEGQDLRSVLDKRGPLSWEEALSLIDQVCQALEIAKKHDIIHRDIKPQNIMLTDNNLIKVLDFGIARSRALPSLTQSGFVGSPYYISPEQAMGEEVDIRSDIYSTGIVLYEILSGQVPFDAQSPWSIISQHIAAEPPEIEVEADKVPPSVQNILRHMVAKNPEDRFQDPISLRKAIAMVLEGEEYVLETESPLSAEEKAAQANELYKKAEGAVTAKEWQRAVSLLSQVIELNPKHSQAQKMRTQAGTQARLTALYEAAIQALDAQRWQEAIDELSEILEIDTSYKDTSARLAEAKAAIERSHLDLELSSLYEQAVAHFEAEDYENAEEVFAQIRKTTPNYKRVDVLWAESRRRLSKGGGLTRLTEELSGTVTDAKSSQVNRNHFKWIGWTVLGIVIIAASVWGVSLLDGETDAQTVSLDERYAQAVTAFETSNIDEATQILEEILSQQPDHPQALILQETIDNVSSLEEQLATAEAAISEKNWTVAVDTLEALAEYPQFQPDAVNKFLCDSYLARGKDRLAKIVNPRDQATVSTALSDFQNAQPICNPRDEADQQVTFATDYLAAINPNIDLNIAVEKLRSIVLAQQDYAGEQAIQNLYQAYIARGDALRADDDVAAALEDYRAALNLNVDDLSEAQRKEAQALQLLADATATPESQAVGEGTPTPADGADATPTPSQFRWGRVTLIGPESGVEYTGELAEIILEWQPIALAEDEYYDVTVRWFVGEEPRYWGAPLTESRWQVPVEAGYGEAGKDEYSWWVTIRQKGTDTPLSPPSEERIFIWKSG